MLLNFLMSHRSGIELHSGFYRGVLGPLLADVPHSAAFVGWGSDVLGFDTARSTDHGWGPRPTVFVTDERVAPTLALLDTELPDSYDGTPVRFGWDAVPVQHHITVTTLRAWSLAQLRVDARTALRTQDWLRIPQQKLAEVTGGVVLHDPEGELAALGARLTWYPDAVWRWVIACQWQRIAEEEAFPGRTREVGDVLGSRIVTARLVRDVTRLALLLGRRWAPYSKWLGSAFSAMPDPDGLGSALLRALDTGELGEAYVLVARRCNDVLDLDVDPTLRTYHSRPYDVLMAERFTQACLATVSDSWLRGLPLTGSCDQVFDNTAIQQYGHPLAW